jgi:hypothetical protein
MQKICFIIDSPLGEFYRKNCAELRLFRRHNLLNFKYFIIGVTHTEKEDKEAEKYFMDYRLDQSFCSPDPYEPEQMAIDSAIHSQCDLIILLGGNKRLDPHKLRDFILNVELCRHESVFTYKMNEFVAYKVKTNGYKIHGIKDGYLLYSGDVVTSNHFELKIINEEELPRKDFS